MSYGENLICIYDEMKRQNIKSQVVFLYKHTCKYRMDIYSDVKSIKFESGNILHIIRSIYHLSTSQYIIIDNYFGSLSKIKLKKGCDVFKFGTQQALLKIWINGTFF